jgi:hypothetical protein
MKNQNSEDIAKLLKQATAGELVEWMATICDKRPDVREALLRALKDKQPAQ